MKILSKYLTSFAFTFISIFSINTITFAQRSGGHGGGGFHGGGGYFHGRGEGYSGLHGGSFNGRGQHGITQSRSFNNAPQRFNRSGFGLRGHDSYRGNGFYGGARGHFYQGGYRGFYGGYYGRYYAPHLGYQINALPYGYYPFYYDNAEFYYNDGLFYQQYAESEYTVVEPPIGAQITQLPQDAKSIMINGLQYYVLNGVYYQPVADQSGNTVYQIVGKDGQLNTGQD